MIDAKVTLTAVSGIASLVLALSACTPNPVTGQQELRLMSAEQERSAGVQAARQVEQSIGLVQDPRLTSYVRAVGERLAAASPRTDVRYQFFVADMAEPNALNSESLAPGQAVKVALAVAYRP